MTEPEARTPEQAIRVENGDDTKVMVGVTICEGPTTYRLLLTHPHQAEGQIVDIPRERIESIDGVEPSPRGATPAIVET